MAATEIRFSLYDKTDMATHAPKECERSLTHIKRFCGESSAGPQVDLKWLERARSSSWLGILWWLGSGAGFSACAAQAVPKEGALRLPYQLAQMSDRRKKGCWGLQAINGQSSKVESDVVYTHSGILCGLRKEGNPVICYNYNANNSETTSGAKHAK